MSRDDFEKIVSEFEEAWRAGNAPQIDQVLASNKVDATTADELLIELVAIDMEYRWRAAGQDTDTKGADTETNASRPSAWQLEQYEALLPGLTNDEIISELLIEEFRARHQWGDRPSVDEYVSRYGDVAESLLPELNKIASDQTVTKNVPHLSNDEYWVDLAPPDLPDYELLEELGRGGMGIVYRARQVSADRLVALKIVRSEYLQHAPKEESEAARQRFQTEARATAMLQHDHIVTVYHVGEVSGCPFFSMQLVDGKSLFERIREQPLSNQEAADFLHGVAKALAEAHESGILHRDLKPQNILIDERSNRALVADFGLAKLQGASGELTRHGEVMGTPQYMSPEQARNSAAATTASDVYSLGATLYHALTGRPPFQAGSVLETLRLVLEEEPIEPRQLNPSIDRDLETICQRCLEKEPSRRIGSADELADELQRYLSGMPIRSRSIGRSERLYRWCARNPITALLIGMVSLLLTATIASTTVGYVWTTVAKRKSEQSFRDARLAFDRVVDSLRHEALLEQPTLRPVKTRLLGQAHEFYQQYLDHRIRDGTMPEEIGATYFRIGQIGEEVLSVEEALESYQRALSVQQRLVRKNPDEISTQEGLGKTWNAIGQVQARMTKTDQAFQAFKNAISTREQLVDLAVNQNRDDFEYRRQLANSHMNLGIILKQQTQLKSAQHAFQKANSIRQEMLDDRKLDHELLRDMGLGHYNVGRLALATDDLAAAVRAFRSAESAFRRVQSIIPQDIDSRYRRGEVLLTLGELAGSEADEASTHADEELRKAVAIAEQLANDHPSIDRLRFLHARALRALGVSYYEQGDDSKVCELLEPAKTLLLELHTKDPHLAQYTRDLATTHVTLGDSYLRLGRIKETQIELQSVAELVRLLPNETEADRTTREFVEHQLAALQSAMDSIESQ